ATSVMRLFAFRFGKNERRRATPPALRSTPRMNGHGALAAEDGWLTAEGVKKSYRGRMVVKGVSLATARGEAVGLLGPNGAGKTTVFYMITGLVPTDAGCIPPGGRRVHGAAVVPPAPPRHRLSAPGGLDFPRPQR